MIEMGWCSQWQTYFSGVAQPPTSYIYRINFQLCHILDYWIISIIYIYYYKLIYKYISLHLLTVPTRPHSPTWGPQSAEDGSFLRSLRLRQNWHVQPAIRTTSVISLASWYISPTVKLWLYGYGSIPINTIFSGMNIHLPAILMFTRGTRFWHTARYPLITAPSSWVSGILGIVEVWDGKASVDRFKWFNGWAPATTRIN